MKTPKVLIYMKRNELRPVGGPSGYLYNLNTGLKEIKSENIDFLPSDESFKQSVKRGRLINLPLVGNIISVAGRFYVYYSLFFGRKNHKAMINLNQYDIIHFHNVKDMLEIRDSLRDYKGLTFVTSHSPKPFSQEIMEEKLTTFERIFFRFLYNNLIDMEKFSFSNADLIIFPCKEAEEPYANNWDEYKNYATTNKMKYLVTGSISAEAKKSPSDVRNEFGIPEDAFVISYVGRHNETKGYDQLKKIGERILSKNPNTYFLIAGKEEPLRGLEDNRWIEVGWTNDPHSIINASDLFILPNKETYFDLVMIEVLSLGKIVVASNTGGNKYFRDKDCVINLYDGIDDAVDQIIEYIEMDKLKLDQLGIKNRTYYEENLTELIFAENYVDLMDSSWRELREEQHE